MKILVITDHTTHGIWESIYALLKSINRDRRCQEIYVASRGLKRNSLFFEPSNYHTNVSARSVDEKFKYHKQGKWFEENHIDITANDFDVLFIRLDRPVSDSFLDSLSKRFPSKLIINNPEGIKITASKQFLLQFPELCPDMQLCKSMADIRCSLQKYPIVLKPLHGYGGKGLVKIDGNRVWDGDKETTYDNFYSELENRIKNNGSMLAVKYLKHIHLGDKRIVVVNGKVLGAMLRIPKQGSWLANISQGGTAEFCEITPEEYRIAEIISSPIIDNGVVIFGFDTLVNDANERVLSEINTLNVGGFLQAEQHSGQLVIDQAAKQILNYANNRL